MFNVHQKQARHGNRWQKLLEIGIALTQEKDYDRLLEMVLISAKELTNADGGTLFTITPENKLHFEIVRTDSLKLSSGELKLQWGGTDKKGEVLLPDIPLQDEKGQPNIRKVSVYAYTHKCTVNVHDVYKTDLFDFSGPKEFDLKTGYHSKSILAVPLKNRRQEVVGILQLLNAKDESTGEFIAFNKDDEEIVEYFASLAAVAMTNYKLVEQVQGMYHSLEKVLNIGVALSAERDHDRLLEMILENAKELTNADGGTLYTLKDGKLHFEIVRTESLKLKWGGTTKQADVNATFPDIVLYNEENKPNDHMVVVYAVLNNVTVNIEDAYSTENFDFTGTRAFDLKTGYRSKSFLTVPLKNHEEEIIGVLQLLNAQNAETGEVIAFSESDQRLVESFASQAAIAMTNENLILELRKLFESLIHVLADAIDEKSPITGRHCKRVPIIADLLAKAVSETNEGVYRSTTFSAAELYELNIAALLHDCGKVVTPVHVVEKSKKLETIIDRIDLLDSRLEILRRDALIKALEGKLNLLLEKQPDLAHQYEAEFSQIDEMKNLEVLNIKKDRDFLHSCNKGMESMSSDSQSKLREMALKPWEDSDQNVQSLLSEDELKNLLILKGTLTEEERKIIQYHVVMTMRMLKEIPYPKYLRDVPEIAGKHHERMDGKGYPLGITGDQMSTRARILAIADIFEALTAPDRPYKECMPLSVALNILEKMKNEGHIDPDLYDIFVRQKVYLKYAKEHLKPEQIDIE